MKKFLIIDDHELVRDGVKAILRENWVDAVFGEAGNDVDALRLAGKEMWDAAVLDLSLAGRSGLELLKQIKLLHPTLPVLILSMHSEEQYATRAFKAGASGYLSKDSPRMELGKAVTKLLTGGRYVSFALAEKFGRDLQRGTDRPPLETLSDREFEVLRLIASGNTVIEIAELLHLSDKTVSTYRARLLEKMEMKSSAALMHYAIRNNLVD